MIHLRPVVRDDLETLFELKLRKDQRQFVAPNAGTLAEAHFEDGSHCFAICLDEKIIGLLACIDFRVNQNLSPEEDRNCIFLWRFMIAKKHQKNGYGRVALTQFLDWCRDQGVPRVSVEVVDVNTAARSLYESFGFTRTGRIFDNELEYSLVL